MAAALGTSSSGGVASANVSGQHYYDHQYNNNNISNNNDTNDDNNDDNNINILDDDDDDDDDYGDRNSDPGINVRSAEEEYLLLPPNVGPQQQLLGGQQQQHQQQGVLEGSMLIGTNLFTTAATEDDVDGDGLVVLGGGGLGLGGRSNQPNSLLKGYPNFKNNTNYTNNAPYGGGGGGGDNTTAMKVGMIGAAYTGIGVMGGGIGGGEGNESVSLGTATATQTHEVRMPLLLSTFKPATGCTNASDFIVRCFVARLRCGITVVKHGRSRWCKSRLRILHVHPDGRSLSWKPALGEPSSSKRPPKLDLTTCREVRHAWSPDPDNPMFTGSPILRQKCEAANAHKSFALIFPKRTVDITAVTADQCKVLMEGFSALCFRLQVAQNVQQQQAAAAAAAAGTSATGEHGIIQHEDKTSASTNTSSPSATQKKGRRR
jgi:hypothetical protein